MIKQLLKKSRNDSGIYYSLMYGSVYTYIFGKEFSKDLIEFSKIIVYDTAMYAFKVYIDNPKFFRKLVSHTWRSIPIKNDYCYVCKECDLKMERFLDKHKYFCDEFIIKEIIE